MCLSSMHTAPLLGSLVTQLLRTDKPAASRIGDKRKARLESMLILLLDKGNLRRIGLAEPLGISESTATEDATTLEQEGLVSSWFVGKGTVRIRWFSLTPKGVKRAKELKEMGE